MEKLRQDPVKIDATGVQDGAGKGKGKGRAEEGRRSKRRWESLTHGKSQKNEETTGRREGRAEGTSQDGG